VFPLEVEVEVEVESGLNVALILEDTGLYQNALELFKELGVDASMPTSGPRRA